MDLATAAQIQGFFDIPVDNLLCVARVCAGHPETEFKGRMDDLMGISPDVWRRCPRRVELGQNASTPLSLFVDKAPEKAGEIA